nr:unnamed protein product [Digitaria exilis]
MGTPGPGLTSWRSGFTHRIGARGAAGRQEMAEEVRHELACCTGAVVLSKISGRGEMKRNKIWLHGPE